MSFVWRIVQESSCPLKIPCPKLKTWVKGHMCVCITLCRCHTLLLKKGKKNDPVVSTQKMCDAVFSVNKTESLF